jgi:hypothetical protein
MRLLEPDADTLVDHATRKTTPKARALQYWHKQRSDPNYRQATKEWLRQHVAVVDPSGSWMGRWQQQFNALQIRHLRSSSAVHPDPLVGGFCWCAACTRWHDAAAAFHACQSTLCLPAATHCLTRQWQMYMHVYTLSHGTPKATRMEASARLGYLFNTIPHANAKHSTCAAQAGTLRDSMALQQPTSLCSAV